VKIKLDENLSVEAAVALRARGHDAATVLEQSLGGCRDPVVLAACQNEGRVIVTLDTDFANIVAYPVAWRSSSPTETQVSTRFPRRFPRAFLRARKSRLKNIPVELRALQCPPITLRKAKPVPAVASASDMPPRTRVRPRVRSPANGVKGMGSP
jgi:hypothetical protein